MTGISRLTPRYPALATLLGGALLFVFPAGAQPPDNPAKEYAAQATAWTNDAAKMLFDETARESVKASYDFIERQMDLARSLRQLEIAETPSERALAAAQSGIDLARTFLGGDTPSWVETARSTFALANDLQGKSGMDGLKSLATSDFASKAFMGAGLSPATVATMFALVNAYGNLVRAWMDYPAARSSHPPLPRLNLPDHGHIVSYEHNGGTTTVVWEANKGDAARIAKMFPQWNHPPVPPRGPEKPFAMPERPVPNFGGVSFVVPGTPLPTRNQPKSGPSRGGIKVSAQVTDEDFAPRH